MSRTNENDKPICPFVFDTDSEDYIIENRKDEVYMKALNKWGDKQLGVLQEECAELIQAVSKHFRGIEVADNLAEEIADVEIMLEQAKIWLNNHDLVYEHKKRKLKKLNEKIKGEMK